LLFPEVEMRLLALVVMVVSPWLHASAQESSEVIARIRRQFNRIEAEIPTYRVVLEPLRNDVDGIYDTARVYFAGSFVRYVRSGWGSDDSYEVGKFYYWDGHLVFAFVAQNDVRGGHAEWRYYFDADSLVRVLETRDGRTETALLSDEAGRARDLRNMAVHFLSTKPPPLAPPIAVVPNAKGNDTMGTHASAFAQATNSRGWLELALVFVVGVAIGGAAIRTSARRRGITTAPTTQSKIESQPATLSREIPLPVPQPLPAAAASRVPDNAVAKTPMKRLVGPAVVLLGVTVLVVVLAVESADVQRQRAEQHVDLAPVAVTPAVPASPPDVPAPVPGPWTYSEREDEMSGKMVYAATTWSENTVDFAAPYAGAQHGLLLVRRHPRLGQAIILVVERGQFLCTSYDGCTVLVRFDDAAPVTFRAYLGTDERTTALFIGYDAFMARLRGARRVLIAPTFYQDNGIFMFDVSGFDEMKLARQPSPEELAARDRLWQDTTAYMEFRSYARAHGVYLETEVDRKAESLQPVVPEFTQAGEAVLAFVVDTDGAVPGEIQIVRTHEMWFASVAVGAVRVAQFSPAEKDGRRVKQLVRMTFSKR
jgi:hypothetical protein